MQASSYIGALAEVRWKTENGTEAEGKGGDRYLNDRKTLQGDHGGFTQHSVGFISPIFICPSRATNYTKATKLSENHNGHPVKPYRANPRPGQTLPRGNLRL